MNNKSVVRRLTRVKPKALVVLGNGKTLADYPFDKYNVDTVGISQAFRYWRKIGWYPTYYVCLDKNININFARDIKHLIKFRAQNGIKRFFLTTEILKRYPKLAKISCVHFVEYLNKSGVRGFNGQSGITSGAFAVRFGIYLQYQEIYLLGVDANYRPINLKWIKSVSNANQRLKQTINPEPDYFFVGYRAKGDYLHIPPKKRWKVRGNHLVVFQRIAREFNRGPSPRVFNSNPKSKLHPNILPYRPIPPEFLAYLEVKEETKENPVKEETKEDPVKEETKEDSVKEEIPAQESKENPINIFHAET